MSAPIKIKWAIDDGYLSSARLQHIDVTLDDFYHCESEQDIRDEIDQIVRDEFETKISYGPINESEVVAAVVAAKKAEPK